MVERTDPTIAQTAKVDHLVDEKGSRVELPPGSTVGATGNPEAAVGNTGPTNWWLYGLIGLGIVIAVIFVMQMVSGAPGTDVQPGSPTAEPVLESPAQ